MTAPNAIAPTKQIDTKPLPPCGLCGGERDKAKFSQCLRCRQDDDRIGETER